MATTTLERVNALIHLAVDKASSTEESRTAALSAVKLIHKHQLLVESPEYQDPMRGSAPRKKWGPPVEPAWRAKYDTKKDCGGWRLMGAPNRALCGVCNRIVRENDPIMFLAGEPYMHPTCWEGWVTRVHSERTR